MVSRDNYKTDCFWFTTIKDMNATIPECIYKNTPYECECTVDCPYYINKIKAEEIIRKVVEVINE